MGVEIARALTERGQQLELQIRSYLDDLHSAEEDMSAEDLAAIGWGSVTDAIPPELGGSVY